jgi:hypothetical protein
MRILSAVLAAASLLALPASAQSVAEDAPQRYWIEVDAQGAEVAPSPRAVARRALRASPHAPTHPDRALNPALVTALRALGIEPRVQSRWLRAVSAELTPAQRAAVQALPGVRGVRPVARLAPATAAATMPFAGLDGSPVRTGFGQAAAQLAQVRADEVLNSGLNGTGVLLGYLDTLFDFAHPTMSHVPASGRLVAVQDFTGGSQSNYHGLATSSIGASFQDNVLVGPGHGASMIMATTEFAPTETNAEEDYFVAGLEWMEAQGVDVVNVSLGYTTFDAGEQSYTYADMDGNTALVTRAADIAVSLGVVMVVSAGNEGGGSWRFISAPADADSVITVGAVTSSGARASFSSVGPTADGRTKPDVAALGVGVFTASRSGGVSSGNGTSYSAPMVAGVATQLLQARPSLTPIQVREILRQTASQALAPDNFLGWGVINAVAAVQRATAAEPRPGESAAWRVYPTVVRADGALTLDLDLAEPAGVSLDVVDLLGRTVRTVSLGEVAAGPGLHSLDLGALGAGTYLLRASTGGAQRFVVVR